MDPQSVVFQPQGDLWRIQGELQRVQAVQAEHSDRLLRLERKQDEDARMKSVWGGASPFPGILSGTPQQSEAPLQQPTADAFKNFDDESANLIGSLHLDPEDEPRRIGATSRANSVRFDESANQGHWSHTSRSSMDLIRNGGLAMSERTPSHKSDGRASSVHSARSVASGRANSLNLDAGFGFGDSHRSPMDTPGLAPGLLLLGSVPAIIRCWMTTNFRHDALMYAAVCTGSHKSFLDRRLIDKLGFSHRITVPGDGLNAGHPTITLPMYLPEAIPHPASSRSASPAPQLPTVTVTFNVTSSPSNDNPDANVIQIVLGSDALRMHNADILFSSNNVSMFDDERNKLSIPLVRPEDQRVFNGLRTVSAGTSTDAADVKTDDVRSQGAAINGLGQSTPSSAESMPSLAATLPIGSQRLSVRVSTEALNANMGVIDSSDDDRSPPVSRSIRFARAPQSMTPVAGATDSGKDEAPQRQETRAVSSPAIWTNWRQRAPESTPPTAPVMNYASAGKSKEAPLRKESGMKVLRPMKAAGRSFSTTSNPSTPGTDGRSRFFDDGKRKGLPEGLGVEQNREAPSASAEESVPAPTPAPATGGRVKANPAGGASAFSWLKTGDSK